MSAISPIRLGKEVGEVGSKRFRVYSVVGTDSRESSGWQIWAHDSSFYIVNEAVAGLKVSLHGVDASRAGSGRFHVRIEEPARQGSIRVITPRFAPGDHSVPFRGASTRYGRLAVRIRTTSRACSLGGLSAARSRPSSVRASLPIPPPGWSADLDLAFQQVPRGLAGANNFEYSFNTGNYGSRIEVGIPGPLGSGRSGFAITTGRGIVLNGSFRNRRYDNEPTPVHLLGRPSSRDDGEADRQIALGVESDSILWIVEDTSHWAHVPTLRALTAS